ncbi:MAG: LysM domain-containing protein [Planctomycetota bacterium]
MQQIERVGVVALLFLVVTIITVAMWDDGSSADTVRAAQSQDTRTAQGNLPVGDARAAVSPTARARNDGLRSTRAHGELQPTGSRLAMRGDALRLERRAGGQPAPGARSGRGPVPGSYDSRGILDLPAGSNRSQEPRDQNFRAQDFGGMGFAVGQPAEYAPPSAAKQPRKTVQPTAAGTGTYWTYVVKKGDTLERIARHQLGDARRWPEIQALNGNLDPRRVGLGQKLTMPAVRGTRGAPRQSAKDPATIRPREATYKKSSGTPAKAQGGEYYVVQPGDVLGTIALKKLGTSKRWREILDLNPKVDPRRLLVGTKLRLPQRGGGTPAPVGPRVGPKLAQGDVRTTPASVRKGAKKGFVVR